VLTDARCRHVAFMLTGGSVADCTAGAELLSKMPACVILHGDKGYDSDAIRRQVENVGAMPNIPPKTNCKWKNCFSPFLYRNRNARAHVLQAEGLQARRHTLRPKRHKLPRSRLHCCDRQLLVMSLDPSAAALRNV
jgi:hypothetical protein